MRRPRLATTAAVLLINVPFYVSYGWVVIAKDAALDAAAVSRDAHLIVDDALGTMLGLMVLLVSIPSLFALFGSKAACGWLLLLFTLGGVLATQLSPLDPSLLLSPQVILSGIGMALLFAPRRSRVSETVVAA